jgi:wobble nucleotide-excising tRNase
MLTVYACRRSSSSKLSRTQDDVDEIVDIMKDNVNKVLERDQMLTDMEDKAGV